MKKMFDELEEWYCQNCDKNTKHIKREDEKMPEHPFYKCEECGDEWS